MDQRASPQFGYGSKGLGEDRESETIGRRVEAHAAEEGERVKKKGVAGVGGEEGVP